MADLTTMDTACAFAMADALEVGPVALANASLMAIAVACKHTHSLSR